MSRRFQFSLGRLMVAMTLLSVAVASLSVIIRENPSMTNAPLLNTVVWSVLGAVGVFADDRTNAVSIVLVVLAISAFGFVLCLR